VSPFRAAILPLLLLAGCGAPAGGGDEASAAAASAGAPALRVLVLSGGGYHDFDRNLELLFEGLELPPGVDVQFLPLGDSDPAGVPAELRRRRMETLDLDADVDVVLAYTQGDLGLSVAARERLLAWVRRGGGFVGLHCAADSHPGWDAYTRMLGGRFLSHPPYGPLTVRVDVPDHPVSAGLPREWALEDEFYQLEALQLGDGTLLMSAAGAADAGDAATGGRRPVTWVKPYGNGRVVYTILGHGPATHRDARYRQLVGQALLWAAGG
jgi:hypothetical protein